MSFDALLSLIFVLLFIGGPLLRRMSGGKKQPGRGQQKPPAQPEQTRERQAPSESESGGDSGDWSRRLEEARKRVLEAMGEQEEPPQHQGDTRADTGQGGSSGGLDWQPAPYTTGSGTRPALDWQGDPNRGGQQRSTLDWQQPASSVEPFIKPARKSLKEKLAESESLPVVVRTERRRQSRKAARIRPERLPALDKDGILNGIMWHEILSDPVSRRGTRRQTSRLRSR